MATSRELKALLLPLLTRRSDLAFAGRTLFFRPFTHYLRGVEFLTSRFNTASRAISFAHQLYNGQDSPDFGHNRGYKYRMPDDWEQDLNQTSVSVCDTMERDALPPVERIVDYIEHQRLPEYLGLLPGLKIADSPKCTFTVALGECSVGDFDGAQQRMSAIMGFLPEYPVQSATDEHRYSDYLFWRMAYLTRVLQTDRGSVLPLLHDWEAYAVKGMKLTKYWKPTPFPCEP
jgi:hypothetical protein